MSLEEILASRCLSGAVRRSGCRGCGGGEKVRCRGSVRPGCARTGVSNHWATTTERASRFQPPRSCGSDAESPWLPVMRTKIDGLRTVTHTNSITTFSQKRKLGRARKANRRPVSHPPIICSRKQSRLFFNQRGNAETRNWKCRCFSCKM